MGKAKTRRVVRGTLTVGKTRQPAHSDPSAPSVKTKHRWTKAEINDLLGRAGDAPRRDRKGRYKRAGLLARLRRRGT